MNLDRITITEGIITRNSGHVIGPAKQLQMNINRDGRVTVKRQVSEGKGTSAGPTKDSEIKGQLMPADMRLLFVELQRLSDLPCLPNPGSDDIYHCDIGIEVVYADGTIWNNYNPLGKIHDSSKIRPSDRQIEEFSDIAIAIKNLVKKVTR
jgi:hypothetical protein